MRRRLRLLTFIAVPFLEGAVAVSVDLVFLVDSTIEINWVLPLGSLHPYGKAIIMDRV